MRVPIRKPGKYTHDKKDPHITQDRFNALKTDLERIKKVVQPRLRAEVERLALFGDFSENAEYQIAKGRLRGINRRIDEIEDLLKRAVIIRPKKGGAVGLGSTITVESSGKTRTYRILGSTETDPQRGIISHNSPIGSALMGKREGEEVTVRLADKIVKYKIVEIA
jgi:transcription elongation factor GreA